MTVNLKDPVMSLIDQLASVYFIVDKQLRLTQPSALLCKYLKADDSNNYIHHLLDCFEIVRPNKIDTFQSVVNAKNSMILLITKEKNFAVRGQFVSFSENSQQLIFVGAPWLAWMNANLPSIQLMINDFKPVDPQLDQLILLATEQQNTSDLQQLASDLQIARDKELIASKAQADFFAIMSHEMRTPLSGVVTALELINQEPLNEHVGKMIEIAKNSAENLKHVVDHVLNFSKLQAGGFENLAHPFDLRATVQSVVDIVSTRASEQGTQLLQRIDPSIYEYINADGDKVRQILLNLLSNAVKFTTSGSVQIIATIAEKDQLKINVIDSGKGIPITIQDKIFEPFLTFNPSVSDKESGTGLGLNISKRLVKIMNGEIGFCSTEGQGSNFFFIIPITKASKPVDDSAIDKHQEKLLRFSAHVLLVEDNKANQYLNRLLLEARGVTVDVADDGCQAIEKIVSTKYDAVFMDISMPVMDGITATRILRKTHSKEQLPIVAMTAHIGDSYQKSFIEEGMDDVITKPIDSILLTEMLQKLFIKNQTVPIYKNAKDNLIEAKTKLIVNPNTDKMINTEVLEELFLSIGNEAFIDLTELFSIEIIKGTEDIISAYFSGDMQLLADKVHTIISSSKAVGFDLLTDTLLSIQYCSSQNNHGELEALIKIVSHTAKTSIEALKEFKQSRVN